MIDSYDVLWSSYDRHKLIYKVMIINKNSNHSQPLKPLFTLWTMGQLIWRSSTIWNTFHCPLKYTRNQWRKNCNQNLSGDINIRYRVLDRATNWKPNNTGRVQCNSSSRRLWFRFFLNYIISSISELHIQFYMTREQWRKFIFTVNSYMFNS